MPNPLLTALAQLVVWPHLGVILAVLVAYPLISPIREMLGDNAFILLTLPLALLARVFVRNFYENRTFVRGAYLVVAAWFLTLVTGMLVLF